MAPPFLIFDATSTAIALVFITMGILTTDPQEAAERVSQIEQLPSFSPLAAFLATNLPRATLQELRPNSSLDGLIQTCAQDWFAAYAPSVAPRTHSDVQPRTVVTDHKNQFTAFLVDASRRDALFFTLQNASWRFVHVDLQAVDASGKELAVQQPLVTAMKGGEPYNWGSLFTGTVGNPTQHDLTVDASQLPTAAAIRFWVRGPGLHAEANDGDVWVYDLPPSITASDKEAWTMSILYYAAAPFIDLVLGSLDVFKKLFGDKRGSLTDAIWDHIKDKADPSNWISLETNGTLDFKDSMKAAVDLEFTILGLAALIITVLGIETELAAAVAATAILIARASLSLDAANLRFLAQNMWWVGHIGKYELPL